MVEDVDDEDEFDNEDKAEPNAAAQVPLPLPIVPLPVSKAIAPRRGSRSCRSGACNQQYDAYLNLNTKKPDEGTALLNVYTSTGYSFDLMPQNQMTLSTASTQR